METRAANRGLTLASALDGSEPLSRLLARVRESQARLAALAPLLPAALQVRAGPLDDSGWTLLVGHSAAAAKLRQSVPALVQALADAGYATPAIRIKVVPPAR